jgi:hypothetical protein
LFEKFNEKKFIDAKVAEKSEMFAFLINYVYTFHQKIDFKEIGKKDEQGRFENYCDLKKERRSLKKNDFLSKRGQCSDNI